MELQRRDLSKELNALFDATADLPRGSFISHEEISEITGTSRDFRSRQAIVNRWKDLILEKRGIRVMASIPRGAGYRFLTAEEQLVTQPLRYQKQSIGRINEAAKCLGAISDDEMTQQQQAFRDARLQQLAEIKTSDQVQRATVNSWLANPKALPRIAKK